MVERARKTRPPWRFLSHTADIRMEVYGSTMRELFVNAALGLRSLFSPEEVTAQSEIIRISLTAEDAEMLLADWLREVLFFTETRKFLIGHVNIEKITDTTIEADISGRIDSAVIADADVDIKGVTYHDLAIEKKKDGLVARVVFDI